MTYSPRSYPLTWLVVLAIHVLCLMPVPETPLDGIAFIDKWTHLVMYGGLCLTIWYEVFLHHGMKPLIHLNQVKTETLNWRHLRIGALYLPTFLGAYIEVLQATCTNGTRSGDVIDWLADTLGVLIAWGVAWMVIRGIRKVRKVRMV